jgi:hypothetical protein
MIWSSDDLDDLINWSWLVNWLCQRLLMELNFTGWAAVAAAVIVLTSCATKPGEFQDIAKDQPHAVLTASSIVTEPIPIAVSTMVVTRLDDKPAGARWADRFRVSPGPHTVQLKCFSGQTMAVVDLHFTAEAGQIYVARGKRPHRDVHFWIENKASKEVLISKDIPLQTNPNAGPLIVPIVMPLR